jgi:transposase-like protein
LDSTDCRRKFKFNSDAFHGKVSSSYVSQALSEFYTGSSINDIRETLYQEHQYKPSKSIVWKWVTKYTNLAIKQFADQKPKVGTSWECDETMVDLDKNLKVWIYNVIDEKTRYLLASRIAISRTTNNAEAVMREAAKRAEKAPNKILTDANTSYNDGIKLAFGSDSEHIQTSPFKSGDSTQKVERYHGTYKDRVKVMRAFRDVETLIQFNNSWTVYYNYFKPHESLKGKTPAEEAKVKYDIKNWSDLAKMPVSKESEIQSHKSEKAKIVIEKVNTEKALKRKRGPQPHTDYPGESISSMQKRKRLENRARRISEPVPPITQKMGKLK